MEALIVHVMESWPLQLALETVGGREHVVLTEDAKIHRSGLLVAPGALRPGQRIWISVRTTRGDIAEIEIID